MIRVGDAYYRLDVPRNYLELGTPDDSLPLSRFLDEVFVEGKFVLRWCGHFGWTPIARRGYSQILSDAGFPSMDLPWAEVYQAPWGAVYVVWGDEGNVTPFNSFKAYMAACMGVKL